MAGISVDAGGGGKRQVNSEINMVPMIDLLMVTISFLLITAVWTTMARVDANAQVPGPPSTEPVDLPPTPQLHVEMRATDKFELVWKQGNDVLSQRTVLRADKTIERRGTKIAQYPELAREIHTDWTRHGSHRDPNDHAQDTAVLHTDDATPYYQIVAVLDAIAETQRDGVPAFNVAFAAR